MAFGTINRLADSGRHGRSISPTTFLNNERRKKMKTKEAINILNNAVEFFDMNYNTGDKRDTTWEISKTRKALNHVGDKLMREKGGKNEQNNEKAKAGRKESSPSLCNN